VVKIGGRSIRPKQCVKCGAKLPATLTYPKRGAFKWYVREFDPATGKTVDHPCESSEHADETMRRLRRDFTRDPVQRELLETVSVLIRQIDAADRDDAINSLIAKLGGDASVRKLKPIGWDEARETIATEARQLGISEAHCSDLLRVTDYFGQATGCTEWVSVDLDAIAAYRSKRLEGGWTYKARTIKAVSGAAFNADLRTLSSFLSRCVRKGWIAKNVLERQPGQRVKVSAKRVRYMPDADLSALIEAAEPPWMRTLIIVAYYTGSRRGDLLRIAWDRDTDLDGSKARGEGRLGPHVFIRGNKSDTPHWIPLHPAAVAALQGLRRCELVIDPLVFPVRGTTNRGTRVSKLFADACVKAGLTETVNRDGASVVKNRWSLHDLRRKANTDLRNGGASPKERMALLGHRTQAVNEAHYEAVLPDRERKLVDTLPTFGEVA